MEGETGRTADTMRRCLQSVASASLHFRRTSGGWGRNLFGPVRSSGCGQPSAKGRAGSMWELMAALFLLALPASVNASPRLWQPLMIKGATLPQLLGQKIDHFEVLTLREGRLVPIPFQIDEVLPDGSFALPNGPEPVTGDRSGILHRDDEVVMMVSDLGSRAERPGALPNNALEIHISDPLGGLDRYAYIGLAASPLRSTTDYVDFAPDADRIDSEHYRLGIREGQPVDFALQSRKREGALSMIDGFRVRVHAKVLKLFNYSLTEKDVHTRPVAWKDGPVRVIRKDSHSIDVMMGIRSPEVASQVLFYRDYIENPVKVKLPWVPSAIFGDIQVRAYLNMVGSYRYRLAWSGLSSPGVALGYGTTELPQGSDSAAPLVDWVSLSDGDRVMLQAVVPNADMKLIEKQLYYRDATGRDQPRPMLRLASARPYNFDLGYTLTGWDRLSSGTHDFDSLLISAPADYRPSLLFKEMEHAPVVRVGPVEASK